MNDYQRGFDDGLERAALMLQRKADKMRQAGNQAMAHVYETEAAEILTKRKTATGK